MSPLLVICTSTYFGGAERCLVDSLRDWVRAGLRFRIAGTRDVALRVCVELGLRPESIVVAVREEPETVLAGAGLLVSIAKDVWWLAKILVGRRYSGVYYCAPGAASGFGIRVACGVAAMSLYINYQLFPAVVKYGLAKRICHSIGACVGGFDLPVSHQNAGALRKSLLVRRGRLLIYPNLGGERGDVVTNVSEGRWDGPYVVCVGTVDRRKGVDLFIEVARELVDRYPQVRFVWVGAGDVTGFSAPANCEFIGHSSAPLDIVARAACFLFLSRGEGAARSLIEAASVGCPIVTTRVGGVEELQRFGLDIGVVDASEPSGVVAVAVKLVTARLARGNSNRKEGMDFDSRVRFERFMKDAERQRHGVIDAMRRATDDIVV